MCPNTGMLTNETQDATSTALSALPNLVQPVADKDITGPLAHLNGAPAAFSVQVGLPLAAALMGATGAVPSAVLAYIGEHGLYLG